MAKEYKLRSISDKENYATYLLLPLLELSKYSFGKGNFMNSYVTINAQIGVLVREIDDVPWNFWEHINYRTDMPLYDGTLILFKPSVFFEPDVVAVLDSKYSQLSVDAMGMIRDYSGLVMDFKTKEGNILTHQLIKAIRQDKEVRTLLAEYLNESITEDMELEPPLREQDILYDVDTDITFAFEEYQKGK